jgi:hypothetical protein
MNLAASIRDLTDTLRAENDGALSPAEAVIAAEIEPQNDQLWDMYRANLAAAESAQLTLRARLWHGIKPLAVLPSGGVSGMAMLENAEVRDLIDTYCAANRRLYEAARTLVDCLEVDEDAVIWELRMGSGR